MFSIKHKDHTQAEQENTAILKQLSQKSEAHGDLAFTEFA
jgi:hypothetical protein